VSRELVALVNDTCYNLYIIGITCIHNLSVVFGGYHQSDSLQYTVCIDCDISYAFINRVLLPFRDTSHTHKLCQQLSRGIRNTSKAPLHLVRYESCLIRIHNDIIVICFLDLVVLRKDICHGYSRIIDSICMFISVHLIFSKFMFRGCGDRVRGEKRTHIILASVLILVQCSIRCVPIVNANAQPLMYIQR